MIDFDQACILIAWFLAVFSIPGYRLIAMVLFVNFMAFEIAAVNILEALDGAKAWPLYAVYAVISGLTVLALRYLKASVPLFVIMFLFSVYNLMVVIEYPLYDTFGFTLGFHSNFTIVAKANMIIELLFMLLISKGSAYVWSIFKPDSKYHYFIDRFLSDSFRMGNERLV